jgi:hypothetical protein
LEAADDAPHQPIADSAAARLWKNRDRDDLPTPVIGSRDDVPVESRLCGGGEKNAPRVFGIEAE